jgi:hypothetical protein
MRIELLYSRGQYLAHINDKIIRIGYDRLTLGEVAYTNAIPLPPWIMVWNF